MDYEEKFLKSLETLKFHRKKARIERDLTNSYLVKVYKLLSPEEYYILKQRIAEKPLSLNKIAEQLKEKGMKKKVLTRQGIDRIYSVALKKIKSSIRK